MARMSMSIAYTGARLISGDVLRKLAEEALSTAPGVTELEIGQCVSNRVQAVFDYKCEDVVILVDDWLRQFNLLPVDTSDQEVSMTLFSALKRSERTVNAKFEGEHREAAQRDHNGRRSEDQLVAGPK